MPAPKIVISDLARADLMDIEAYIARQDAELRAAAVIARLANALETVAFMPGIGRPRPELTRRNVLVFPVRPWLIVYRPLSTRDGIYVLRVLDGRRDLKRVLRPD